MTLKLHVARASIARSPVARLVALLSSLSLSSPIRSLSELLSFNFSPSPGCSLFLPPPRLTRLFESHRIESDRIQTLDLWPLSALRINGLALLKCAQRERRKRMDERGGGIAISARAPLLLLLVCVCERAFTSLVVPSNCTLLLRRRRRRRRQQQ